MSESFLNRFFEMNCLKELIHGSESDFSSLGLINHNVYLRILSLIKNYSQNIIPDTMFFFINLV